MINILKEHLKKMKALKDLLEISLQTELDEKSIGHLEHKLMLLYAGIDLINNLISEGKTKGVL